MFLRKAIRTVGSLAGDHLSPFSRQICSTSRFPGVPREKADVMVIGAGVVGVAVARALALSRREVVVIESASTFGTGISSRNSEVIHAGIDYHPNTLKANLCIRGRKMLYKYCADHGIPHKKIDD